MTQRLQCGLRLGCCAGDSDEVLQPEHSTLVFGAFGLSQGIIPDVRRGRAFCNAQERSSAREQLQRLRPQMLLASPMTTLLDTIRCVVNCAQHNEQSNDCGS